MDKFYRIITQRFRKIFFQMITLIEFWGFCGCSVGKEPAYSAGDLDSTPGSGRSPGEGNGNPFQHSCLENPMEEEPGGLQSMGSQESDMT